MDTTQGGYAPAIPGQVVQPAAIVKPHVTATHNFFNLLRDMVTHSAFYKTEEEIRQAIGTVTAYEKHLLNPAERAQAVTEDDRAPMEDVSQRVAPSSTAAVVPAGTPAIDYAQLAQAIIAAQAAAQAAQAGGQEH